MFGSHGKVGGSIFLAAYALAVAPPILRMVASAPPITKAAALAIVITSGAITTFSIRAHGGGGAGEGFGILGGVLAWVGLYAAPDLAARIAPGLGEPDLWQVGGASLLPVLLASVLWVFWLARRGK